MPSKDPIRDAIREHFSFLINNDYSEVTVNPKSDECYSEVHFQKNMWRISVLTTSHGTKISVLIISPENQRGFLTHLGKCKSGKNILSDIKLKADFFLEHAKTLLDGDNIEFQRVMDIVSKKQHEWILKTGIASKNGHGPNR